MTQLSLSNELSVITAEINSYKQVAGQAVFEIGKRLKHVKENDLVHGEWEQWLSEHIEMSRQHAHRFIKVYEELGKSNVTSVLQMGVKALYELATMPAEERDKAHLIESSGATKLPSDMTARELEEVKKSLKETESLKQAAEQRAAQSEVARELAIKQHSEQQDKLLAQIEDLKQKKGRSPEDQERLDQLSKQNVELTQALHKLQDELLERNSAMEKRGHDLRKMKESLSKTSAYVLSDLSAALMYFRSIADQKEAIEVAQRFWAELDKTIAKKRAEWQEIIEIDISEVKDNGNTTTRIATGRQAIIIDADSTT